LPKGDGMPLQSCICACACACDLGQRDGCLSVPPPHRRELYVRANAWVGRGQTWPTIAGSRDERDMGLGSCAAHATAMSDLFRRPYECIRGMQLRLFVGSGMNMYGKDSREAKVALPSVYV
jgi:phosphodiesterase/alkaline phosphatase D-like protein